jgi:hypothetical protein
VDKIELTVVSLVVGSPFCERDDNRNRKKFKNVPDFARRVAVTIISALPDVTTEVTAR